MREITECPECERPLSTCMECGKAQTCGRCVGYGHEAFNTAGEREGVICSGCCDGPCCPKPTKHLRTVLGTIQVQQPNPDTYHLGLDSLEDTFIPRPKKEDAQ